jgi:hypothetical protein
MNSDSNRSRASETRELSRGYEGPERRRHRVYVTRNTEYHVRDRLCVAVRDRRTGDFMHGHLAIRRRFEGGLRFLQGGGIAPNPHEPRAGESLYFVGDGRDLVTSALQGVGRPSKEIVAEYPDPHPRQELRGNASDPRSRAE